MDHRAVLAVADAHERSIARAFLRVLGDVRARLPLGDVETMIEQGHLFTIPSLIAWHDVFSLDALYGHFRKDDTVDLADALVTSITSTMDDAAQVTGLDVDLFTRVNPKAVQVARERVARLVTNIGDDTRQGIRRVIASSVRGNLTPAQSARLISSSVGLDVRSANALGNYVASAALVHAGEARASSLVRVGMKAPKDLSAEHLDRLIDRYSARLLKARADLIARTETMYAANEGLILAWQEGKTDGYIPGDSTYQWVTTEDDALCDECAGMDGSDVNPDGGDAPPLHPNCRCTMILIIPDQDPQEVLSADVP